MKLGDLMASIEADIPGLTRMLDEGEHFEDNLRLLLGPKFISLDDMYSLALLDAFAQKHWNCTAQQLIHGTHYADAAAAVDVELHDRGLSPKGHPKSAAPSSNRGGRPRALDVDGKKIRSIRGDTLISIFARLCKLSPRKLERAEKGKATEDTLVRICKYANLKSIKITPEELIKNLHQ